MFSRHTLLFPRDGRISAGRVKSRTLARDFRRLDLYLSSHKSDEMFEFNMLRLGGIHCSLRSKPGLTTSMINAVIGSERQHIWQNRWSISVAYLSLSQWNQISPSSAAARHSLANPKTGIWHITNLLCIDIFDERTLSLKKKLLMYYKPTISILM